jgi:hypothetical protein
VTLSIPKGERNGEHKADLHTEDVLSTRPLVVCPRRCGFLAVATIELRGYFLLQQPGEG